MEIAPVECVSSVEVDRAVQLENDVPAVDGQQIDTDEIGSDCARRTDGKRSRLQVGSRGAQAAAERHVRPPLARRGNPLCRADDLTGGDQHSEIVARVWHDSLKQRP